MPRIVDGSFTPVSSIMTSPAADAAPQASAPALAQPLQESTALQLSQIGPAPQANGAPGAAIDYELFLDCVHCGLCTASCPTYVETGNENDGPRGRIYLMRSVTDGRLPLNDQVRGHLELCLDCRACETACPSGVQYGKLIEPFRVAMDEAAGGLAHSPTKNDWFHRHILFGLFPYAEKLRRALIPARSADATNLAMGPLLWTTRPSR